jgi:hypothetical protein
MAASLQCWVCGCPVLGSTAGLLQVAALAALAALVCCSGLLLMALLPSALCVCSADGAELLPGGIGATLL